ncbi:hypothetical protein ABZ114_22805 [Streptomyces albidoflavus]|uniref:hypothetical protein n=1 Tax=Streptomyces albidoflavus TaxID=1886 RepID=UPI0033AD6DD4
MRIHGITVRAAALAAALTLTPLAAASTAVAGDEENYGNHHRPGRVTVSPSTVSPGGEVTLRVDICRGKEAVGFSEAFAGDAWFGPSADRGELYAEARIRSDAQPRQYEIKVDCKDKENRHARGTVTVVHHKQRPHAPVSAGGGGTAEVAAEADSDGPGTSQAVIGGALVSAAVLAFASHRVRRGRRTD